MKSLEASLGKTDPNAWPLGMSCSVAFPYEWQALKKAGIACIELTWHPLDIREDKVRARCEETIRQVRELGIEVRSVHIPYGHDYDPSLLDESARSQAIGNIRRVLALAHEWEVGIAVLHPSYEPIPPEDRERRLRIAGETLAELARESAELGVTLAAECLPRTCLGNTSQEIRYLADQSPQLGICCDVNHLTQEHPEDFISAIGSRIVTTHISDNDGLDEKHWMPGDGVLNWPAIIGALTDMGYDGAFVYEVRVKPPFVVAENWRMLLADSGVEDRRTSNDGFLEDNTNTVNTADEARAVSDANAPDAPIAVTDQASGRILIFDPAEPDWNNPEALLWTWHPSDENGFGANNLAGWGLPSDVKLRRNRALGGQWLIACDSNGLAVLVSYPQGKRRWSRMVGGNPHAVELLPNGNIAVAASHGGWVRVYASSVSADTGVYAQFDLAGAHGLLWDDKRQCLWAIGDHILTSIDVAGSSEAPILLESDHGSIRLPTEGGHDLFPANGAPERMWVTTHEGVYQYDKQAHAWLDAGIDAAGSRCAFVKSIGNQPSGQRVYTIPDRMRPSCEEGLYDWTTDTVLFAEPADVRTLTGAAFYKARIWRSFG